MIYTIELYCRAGCFYHHILNDELRAKLKENPEEWDELWCEYQTEYELYQYPMYWVGDSFSLFVKDEDDNEVWEATDLDDIKFIDTGDQVNFVDDPLYICRDSVFKGAGWLYLLETEEEFDPSKLCFHSSRDHYFEGDKELCFIEQLYYDGVGYLDIEGEGDESFFDEQDFTTYVADYKDGKQKWVDAEDL